MFLMHARTLLENFLSIFYYMVGNLKILTMFNFPIIWFYKFKVEGGQNNVEITINFSKKRSNELM